MSNPPHFTRAFPVSHVRIERKRQKFCRPQANFRFTNGLLPKVDSISTACVKLEYLDLELRCLNELTAKMRIIDWSSDDSPSTEELSLTALRKKWCGRDCLISDFLSYLVEYQGMLGLLL